LPATFCPNSCAHAENISKFRGSSLIRFLWTDVNDQQAQIAPNYLRITKGAGGLQQSVAGFQSGFASLIGGEFDLFRESGEYTSKCAAGIVTIRLL